MKNCTDWTLEDIEFLKNNYGKISNKELADILQRSKNAIVLKANRSGVVLPKVHNYNIEKFKSIDTELDAYWFGFLCADGGVSYHEDYHTYELNLELKVEDKPHIKKFLDFMEVSCEIKERCRKSRAFNNDKLYKTALVRLYSMEILKNLEKCGMPLHDKVDVLAVPNISKPLLRHYIRGFFDGDGSIYFDNQRSAYVGSITSKNEEFLLAIRKIIKENDINSYISSYISNISGNRIYHLHIKGKKNAVKFFNYIYSDSNISLDRKYNLYLNCLNKQ